MALGSETGALPEFEDYLPQGISLLWDPWLVILWAGGDLMILIACLAIPAAIAMVLKKRGDVAHRGLVLLFAGFILLCGLAHALDIVTLWYPAYPLTVAVKLATGTVALLVAASLFRLVPFLLQIPSPDRHAQVIEQLEVTMADLSQTRDQLEGRVKQRTEELNEANMQLAFTARDAVQRSRNLIQVVSSLTRPGVDVSENPETFLRELRGRISALVVATTTVMEQSETMGADLEYLIRRQIEPLFVDPIKQLSTEGPATEIGTQGAQQISLVTWELASRFAQLGRSKQSRGRIALTWAVTKQSGREDDFTLEWRETFGALGESASDSAVEGDGTYTPEPLADFSETLLIQIIPRLLGGKGRIDIAPATFIYRLTCPLNALDNPHNPEALMPSFGDDTMAKQLLTGM